MSLLRLMILLENMNDFTWDTLLGFCFLNVSSNFHKLSRNPPASRIGVRTLISIDLFWEAIIGFALESWGRLEKSHKTLKYMTKILKHFFYSAKKKFIYSLKASNIGVPMLKVKSQKCFFPYFWIPMCISPSVRKD